MAVSAMRQPALIFLIDEDPIQGELDGLPQPAAQFVTVFNPRRRDGAVPAFLDGAPETILLPWHRISHIQMLGKGDTENVVSFIRE